MPLRILGYVLRILDVHVTNAESPSKALPLPLVLPVVLHHGEGGWSAARRLEDLFDTELIAEAGILDFIPRLGFVLDDLSGLSDDALQARQLALEPLLALWALRDARSRGRLERAIEHWVPMLVRLWDLPEGRQALWTLFRYILAVADETAAESLSHALQAKKPETKEAIMTFAEKWFARGKAEGEAKGKAEGEAKGKAEGEAKGKAEGKAETLRKLLTLKFGELPGSVSQRLSTASEAELDRFIERVLSATTLEQVVA